MAINGFLIWLLRQPYWNSNFEALNNLEPPYSNYSNKHLHKQSHTSAIIIALRATKTMDDLWWHELIQTFSRPGELNITCDEDSLYWSIKDITRTKGLDYFLNMSHFTIFKLMDPVYSITKTVPKLTSVSNINGERHNLTNVWFVMHIAQNLT